MWLEGLVLSSADTGIAVAKSVFYQRTKAPRALIFNLILGSLLASPALASNTGYTSDIESEKTQSFQEVFVQVEGEVGPKSVQHIIFDSKLSKEFREQYQYEFGQVDAESLSYQTTKYYTQDQNRALLNTSEEDNLKRKQFAQFMTKRLTEHHLDIYLRTDPSLKVVYETKEKLKDVKVQVSQSVRLSSQYSFSGNTLDLVVDNPWVNSRVRLEMDPSQLFPTSPREYQVQLSGSLGRGHQLVSTSRMNEGTTLLELAKVWRKNISTALGASTFYKDNTPIEKRENRISFAFSNSF